MSDTHFAILMFWGIVGLVFGGGIIASEMKHWTMAQLVFAIILSGPAMCAIGIICGFVSVLNWIWNILGKVGKRG